MIELKNIERYYKTGSNRLTVLDKISLSIKKGEFIAITGPSGSGKSTLMNIIGTLDSPSAGEYYLNGKSTSNLSDDELAELRLHTIGFIFQQFHLLPRLTALDNVAMPTIYSQNKINTKWARQRLQEVSLVNRANHLPTELSGGQQQRVAIARALVNKPAIILADEPTGNLDSHTKKEIMDLLLELNREGITIILVTHEPDIAAYASRIIIIQDGKLASDHEKKKIRQNNNFYENSHRMIPSNATLRILTHFISGIKALRSNLLRTILSLAGIMIGVASVVGLMAVGEGANAALERQFRSLGTNLVILRPGARKSGAVSMEAGLSGALYPEDTRFLEKNIQGIAFISGTVSGRTQVTFENKNWNTEVYGVENAYAKIRNLKTTAGRFFTETENTRRERVAILGAGVARELFKSQFPIGAMIRINRIPFQLIGILEERGSMGGRDQDDLILIPIETAMNRVLGSRILDSIEIAAVNSADLESIPERAIDLLLQKNRIPQNRKKDAYRTYNLSEIVSAYTESSKTMGILLSSVAAISLLVGGIGIMNIMLVSVTERTREIGLRKAVGARRFDIGIQFLIETIVISLTGGLLGAVAGSGIALGFSIFLGWETLVTPGSLVLALGFSCSVGMIFGLYPARIASALSPIDALRAN